MQLKDIYRPIEKELNDVESLFKLSVANCGYPLDIKGKRLRPAMVILSAKATLKQNSKTINSQLIKIASAIELIHVASLIHDDVIDHAYIRHNKPTVNSKYGQETSITLGDYLYSTSFELIASCRNPDILSCIASAAKAMCEGELLQVCERDNLDMLKRRYIIIAKKKTASLFVASCEAGAILSNYRASALKGYGLNFGIAFQIIDDYLDLAGDTQDLGKTPGADFKMGELTLPVLNLLTHAKDRNKIMSLIRQNDSLDAFKELKQRFINSQALLKTKEDIYFYIREAKKGLSRLKNSSFKQSLFNLADYLAGRL